MSQAIADIRLKATSLGDLLLFAADQRPDHDAIVLPHRRATYGELRDRALEKARAMQALGIGPGDHVGLLLPTGLDFVETLFAIALLGAVTVPINARYQPPELAYVVENADLKALFTTDKIAEAVNFVERLHQAFPDLAGQDPRALALEGAPLLNNIVIYGGSEKDAMLSEEQFHALADEGNDEALHLARLQVRLGSTGLILYTSGTTANPKGCMISHEAIVRNSAALADRYELGRDDSFWSPLPMFHIAAILPMVSIFSKFGTYVTMGYFQAGEALKMMEAEQVTATYPCFWTIMSDLVDHPDFENTDLSRVKLMNANFAVQPPEIARKMKKALPNAVFVGTFGMTETAGTVTTSRLDDTETQRFTRLGVPLSGLEVKAMNPETGEECAAGERGEAWIRGYSTFSEYYKSPNKTAEALDDEGWFHSGDLVSIDEDGQLMFHGRLRDMLKVGGENVAAVEIESCLQEHEAVKLAQVVGIPDPRLIEVAAAFVELEPGHEAAEDELIHFCKERIAGFKVPRHIRFVSEWPTSSTKIQKFKLQEELCGELGI
ncbi:MAG: class I adenylate-forming enzyme family protein [Xanthomonadales bacterium]|jgi:acyl-CoA synthetase (AMP-forming)/AMP-acid ligase II|nr:class I adenylate-forming enzyme family protein [Xanthomonadales bacterium]